MLDLSLYTVPPHTSVLEAMSSIDKNSKGIVFVCDNDRVTAALSDGDIRRHIIQGGSLDTPVREVANRDFKYVGINDDHETIKKMLIEWDLRCIPILDKNRKLVNLYFYNEENPLPGNPINIPVVIMAGGKGTRLYPYTKVLPKPLIPIGDYTITELIMEKFNAFGCMDFTLIVNHKKNMIKAYFSDNFHDYTIRFVDEDKPLGTGGGLKLLTGIMDNTFFLTNCDIMVFEDYSRILAYHKSSQNILTMVCATKQVTLPYGTVTINEKGKMTAISEKPSYSFLTNTGFYVIEPTFLTYIQEDTFTLITDAIKQCMDAGEQIGVYPVSENKWSDMGQMDEMEKLRKKLEAKDSLKIADE